LKPDSRHLDYMSTITIRTKPQGDKTLVRILIEHPMETGRRLDEKTGQPVPAHFIKDLTVELNGQPVVRGLLSTAVSRNPYFSFRLHSAKPGDRLRVVWLDNRGMSDSAEVLIGG
jgi:sulfur-oxidizing protein SoxZ